MLSWRNLKFSAQPPPGSHRQPLQCAAGRFPNKFLPKNSESSVLSAPPSEPLKNLLSPSHKDTEKSDAARPSTLVSHKTSHFTLTLRASEYTAPTLNLKT
jgi:hypothetical protein